jgi:hypothetical protein
MPPQSLIPTEQRGSECPSPDRKETRKPGVRDRSAIGPCPVFETCFGQEFLISAMRLGGGSNVVQYRSRMRPIRIGSRKIIVVEHPIGEFDIERRPGRTPLIGWSCNLVDHLVLRIIHRYQEVRRAWYAKAGLSEHQIGRGSEQRALARVAQIPKSPVHIDEIQSDGRRPWHAGGLQRMPDIAILAEQPEKLLLVL